MHYALYKKPWQYDEIINQEYFWKYAKESPFYENILETKASFDDVKRAQKEKANEDIVEHAIRVMKIEKTFNNVLFKQPNIFESVDLDEISEILDETKVEA